MTGWHTPSFNRGKSIKNFRNREVVERQDLTRAGKLKEAKREIGSIDFKFWYNTVTLLANSEGGILRLKSIRL